MRHPKILIRLGCLIFVCLFFWAAFFHIDQVVHAQGQVVASDHTQVLQAADNGILAEIKVDEGDKVNVGDVVALLDKDRAHAAFMESRGRVMSLRLTVARLGAELSGRELNFSDEMKRDYSHLISAQTDLFNERRKAIKEQIKVLEQNVVLAESELKMNLPLEELGDISKADVLRLKRTVNEAKGQLASQKNKYLQDVTAELSKAVEDLNSQENILADRSQLLEQTDIVSPVTGIVKSIRLTTKGAVVRQGDEIMQILPTDSSLIVEAKVKPSDMAFMKVGLPAKVKLDAYDYSIFGVMKGEITFISADAISEDTKSGPMTFYRVRVSIGEKEFKGKSASEIDVRPGMTATVDIKSGSRSILAVVTKPLTKTMMDSFGER